MDLYSVRRLLNATALPWPDGAGDHAPPTDAANALAKKALAEVVNHYLVSTRDSAKACGVAVGGGRRCQGGDGCTKLASRGALMPYCWQHQHQEGTHEAPGDRLVEALVASDPPKPRDDYDGQWGAGRGCYHGKGTLRRDGWSYTGNFVNGHIHGMGRKEVGEDTYVGQWFCGKKRGKGMMTRADGYCYVGEFLNDKEHGLGVYDYKGERHEGVFAEGQPSGLGVRHNDAVLCARAGQIHPTRSGQFRGGNPDGCGIETADHYTVIGKWMEDDDGGSMVGAIEVRGRRRNRTLKGQMLMSNYDYYDCGVPWGPVPNGYGVTTADDDGPKRGLWKPAPNWTNPHCYEFLWVQTKWAPDGVDPDLLHESDILIDADNGVYYDWSEDEDAAYDSAEETESDVDCGATS